MTTRSRLASVAPIVFASIGIACAACESVSAKGVAARAVSEDPAVIVPQDRLTTWRPGLRAAGGIPERTRFCSRLAPSGGDDTGAIQAALDACLPGGVVQLEPGTFRITGSGLSITRSQITLRGSGPQRTRLVKPSGSGASVVAVGHRWFGYTAPTDLAVDGRKGAASVRLSADVDLRVGEIVVLDQLTDPRWTRWNPVNQPPGHDSRAWFGRRDRPIGQVLEVKAIDGRSVEFSSPLHIDFLVANTAQLVRRSTHEGGPPVQAVQWVGIEDLALEGGEGHDGGGNVHLWGAAHSWIRNVESTGTLGSSVAMSGTFRCELRDSYLHGTRDPNPGGNGYGVSMSRYASDNLIENNVLWNFNKMMVMRTTGGGNVFGYNYLEDGWGSAYPDTPEVGLNASHMTTPHHELFEGNEAWNFGGDSYWGNSIYITAFRNHLTGERRSVAPLRLTDAKMRRFVDVPEWHWWYSFVGNVLGTEKMRSAPQSGFVAEAKPPWSFDPIPLWVIGPQRDSGRSGQDREVVARTLRHGNYDFFRRSISWDPAIRRRDLPASLYLSEKPPFFGERPWPWVTPEDPESPLHSLPARERFDAMHAR